MMRDMHNNVSPAILLTPGVYAADTTPVTVDLLGFTGAEVVIEVAVGGITFTTTNKIEMLLTQSDDDSTYVAVAQADVLGVATVGTGGIVLSLVAAHAAATVTRLGYIGGKRYLQFKADFSGTHGTGTGLSAVAMRGHPLVQPTA